MSQSYIFSTILNRCPCLPVLKGRARAVHMASSGVLRVLLVSTPCRHNLPADNCWRFNPVKLAMVAASQTWLGVSAFYAGFVGGVFSQGFCALVEAANSSIQRRAGQCFTVPAARPIIKFYHVISPVFAFLVANVGRTRKPVTWQKKATSPC